MNDPIAGVKIAGARQLRQTLKKAGKDCNDLKKMHSEISEMVKAEAAPYSPLKSGKLKRSMRVGSSKTQAVVRAGGMAVPYANPIHWGWKKRGIKPRPFIHIAVIDKQPEIEQITYRELQKIISKIKGV